MCLAHHMQSLQRMQWLFVVAVILGGCVTDEPDCEECEPATWTQHVEDLGRPEISVYATTTNDPMAPLSTTVTVGFAYVGRTPGCPVIDPSVTLSLAGVAGRIKSPGGAYHTAHWQCGSTELEVVLPPTVHAPTASLAITDETGELLLDLGNVLLERAVEAVNNPSWTFANDQPGTFRWSPASDVAQRSDIGMSWGETSAAVMQPITHLDDATFTAPLPPGASNQLWLIANDYRSCGENCKLTAIARVHHAATLNP